MSYAKNSKQPGEVSIREAAGIIGAHPSTIRRWAEAAACREPSPLEYARRDYFGRYWISMAELEVLSSRGKY